MRTKGRRIKGNSKPEDTKKQESKVKENNNSKERARGRIVGINISTLEKAREGKRSSG
jgi:hypothetical protein